MRVSVLGNVLLTDGDTAHRSLPVDEEYVVCALVAAPDQNLEIARLRSSAHSGDSTDAVKRLSERLGAESIVVEHKVVRLRNVVTDVEEFEDAVMEAGQSSDAATQFARCAEALALWRGDPFGGHHSPDLLDHETDRLVKLRRDAQEMYDSLRAEHGSADPYRPDLTSAVTADIDPAATATSNTPVKLPRVVDLTQVGSSNSDADASLSQSNGSGTAIAGATADPATAGRAAVDATDVSSADVRIGGSDGQAVGRHGRLRGYELVGRIGEGAFSIVYEALQPSVGRSVAIKEIRAGLADQPQFIRQFETEAHLVASLEHPNIVPLYDFWRDPGSAYLVMRFLRGGSLADRIATGKALDIASLVRIISAVSGALDVAHASGVIHRDIKPGNILLDDEDRPYLTDFGIAVSDLAASDGSAGLSTGSPAYAPPEQLFRQPIGPTADVYALAISVFESLTQRLPYAGATSVEDLLERQRDEPMPLVRSIRPEVGAGVDEVLQQATSKDPTARFDSAGDFAAHLAEAAGLAPRRRLSRADRNPYKGLAAFAEADAGDFHGRQHLVEEMAELLLEHSVLAVVGPSGSGKSSAVRAGLVPAIRQRSATSSWFVTTMTPGSDPLGALEGALLRVAVDPPADLTARLHVSAESFTNVLYEVAPTDGELVIVVDQFEELFTLSGDEERRRFLDFLVEALSARNAGVRVVVTLRADFYDHPLRHPEFARLIRESTVAVHPLAVDELEQAVTEPANAVGVEFERGLVAAIVADVDDQPGALPLLQYALTELFERRDGGLLTRSAYDELGGVSGALALQAEEVFGGLDDQAADAAHRMFGRLVSLGEGMEDTRRRALRAELSDSKPVEDALSAFGEARLLSFDRHSISREPTVEVAHEALIREWPRLQRWLADDRDGLRLLRHLTEAADAWHALDRDSDELYRGGRLEAAEDWAIEHRAEMTPNEADFLDASVEQRLADEQAEADRVERLETLRSDAERARDAAEEASDTSDIARLGWQAAFEAEDNRQVGLLMAAEAARRSPGIAGRSALQRVLVAQDRFLGVLGAGTTYRKVEWLDDDRIVAFGETGIDVFSADSGQTLATHRGSVGYTQIRHNEGIRTRRALGAVAVDGELIAFADGDLTSIRLLDAAGMAEVERIEVDGRLGGLAISRDGRRVAFAHDDGRLVSVDRADGQQCEAIGHPGDTLADQAYEPNTTHRFPPQFEGWEQQMGLGNSPMSMHFVSSTELVTTRGYETRRWDTAGGMVELESVRSLVIPNGDFHVRVPWADSDADFRLPAMRTTYDDHLKQFVAHSSNTFAVVDAATFRVVAAGIIDIAGLAYFGPKVAQLRLADRDSAWLVTHQGTVGKVDLATSSLIDQPFASQASGASDLALSPDRSRLAVAGETGIVIAATDHQRLLARAIARDGYDAASLGDGGAYLARFNHSSRLPPDTVDLTTGTATPFAEENASGLWVEKDGGGLISVAMPGDDKDGFNMRIRPWWSPSEARSEGFVVEMNWEGSATSHDGKLMACGCDSEAVIFDLDTSMEVARTRAFDELTLSALTFSADDQRLAVASHQIGCRVLAAPDWQVIESPLDDLEIGFVKFSPDGKWLVTVNGDGLIELRDADTYEVVRTMLTSQSTAMAGAALFHRDGELLEVNVGGLPLLFDVETAEQIGDRWPADPGMSGYHSPDNTNVSVTGIGDNFMLWNLDVDSWFDIACKAAGRNMTPEEWELFGPLGKPYRPTCEMWPSLG